MKPNSKVTLVGISGTQIAQVLAPAGVYGRDYKEIWKREPVQTNSPKKKMLEHIEQEEVAAFVVGHLSPRAKQAVVAHLADCPMCRRRVAQVVLSRRIVRDPNESCN